MPQTNLSGETVVPPEAPTLRQLLHVVLAAVIVGALYLARDFLIPLTLAVLLAFVLAPLVRTLRRARLPRVAAVFLAVAISVGAVLGVAGLMGSQIAALGQELPRYQETISAKFAQVSGLTTGRMMQVMGGLGLRAEQAKHQAARAAGLGPKARTAAAQAAAPVQIVQAPPTPLQMARQMLAPLVAPVATAGLVFVVAIFILLQQGDLRDRLIRLIGSSDLYRTTTAMDDAATRLSRYFLSQVGVNAAFGSAIGVGLYFIGVPHAILWGALAALLRFIPYLGALSSVALASAMAAAVDPGWTMVFWTLGLFALVEAVTGQVLEPLIYGHSTGLSPVSVVVAAVFWTWLWGPVGLVMSTPLSLCLLVLGRHVPQLEFIEVLLGDRPPLSPIESFYQRLLAGDVDDLLQQAELALKEGPLARYYDQVAVKGLLLATGDARRRVLRRDQLPLVRESVQTLVADLGERPIEAGAGAPDARAGHRSLAPGVLCVCGPGSLDDLATEMLRQLLAADGLRVRIAAYGEAAPETIDQLDVSDIGAVCVVHLGVGRRPPRLDYLLGRLSQRASGAARVLAMPLETPDGAGGDIPAGWIWAFSLQHAVEACRDAVASPPGKPARRRTAGKGR